MQFLVLCLLTILIYFKSGKKLRIHKDIFLGTVLISNIIFTVSIIISTIYYSHETTRLLAAFNTCGITYIAFLLGSIYISLDINLYKISRYMFANMILLIGLYIFYKLVGMKGNFSFMNGMLCGPDWINGQFQTRFRGYLEYTNLVIYIYLYCFPISLIYVQRKFKKSGCLLYGLLLLFPVLATNSRTGIICSVFMTTIVVIFLYNNLIFYIYKKYHEIFIYSILILVIATVFFLHREIQDIIFAILSARQGSTSTRIHIYISSLKKMWNESPIWGCGIKDYVGGFPYGSHSTYIGMFYKTGIAGGGIYLFGMLISLLNIFKGKENTSFSLIIKYGYVCILALSLLEDIDGANWNIVLFIILFSILFNKKCTACLLHNKL